MIQPSMIHSGWMELKDGDESARTIFDRHYSRRVYADGRRPKLFVGPGTKKVLMLADGRGLFVWRKFISDDGQRGVNCAVFRNESNDVASELIRQAIVIARETWPLERFYTYIDPRKVKPTMFRGYPVWGWCFYKAGFHFVSVGKGGKHVLALEVDEGKSMDARILNEASSTAVGSAPDRSSSLPSAIPRQEP